MIKMLHITLAYLTVIGFVMRAGWSFVSPEMLQQKWVRITPHVIDTFLLLLGVALAFNLADGVLQGWLIAKLLGLLAYIGFGVMCLRGTGTTRVVGLIGALLSVCYIFLVAFTRQIVPI